VNECVWNNDGWQRQGKSELVGQKLLTARVVGEWMCMEQWWLTETGEIRISTTNFFTVWGVGEWMCMEQWWNDTERGIWISGTKIVHSEGGWWMNVYGTMVEWHWQGKSEVLGEKLFTAWVVGEWMGMEHLWNNSVRGNLKCWDKVVQCCCLMNKCVWGNVGMILTVTLIKTNFLNNKQFSRL